MSKLSDKQTSPNGQIKIQTQIGETTTKHCNKCKQIRPIERFSKDAARKSGLDPWCKECRVIGASIWQKRNKDRCKNKDLKLRYNMDLTQYNQMLAAQNNKCGICERDQSQFKKMLGVDHCHITNRIRGLLCDDCNRGIGLLQDNPVITAKATTYLKF